MREPQRTEARMINHRHLYERQYNCLMHAFTSQPKNRVATGKEKKTRRDVSVSSELTRKNNKRMDSIKE